MTIQQNDDTKPQTQAGTAETNTITQELQDWLGNPKDESDGAQIKDNPTIIRGFD